MNRSKYFDYVEEKLNVLAVRIEARGKLNILNFHLHSENFYAYLLKELYSWELMNMNEFQQNVEAIDLIDKNKKIIAQVSATNTKQKVESSLEKEIIKTYPDYNFKFISISKDSEDLRIKTFKNPYGINFNAKVDIIDKNNILKLLLSLEIDDQKRVYEFIKKELGHEIDPIKLDSNLAEVVNILSKENLSNFNSFEINSFDIENKISFNRLNHTRSLIEDYKIYYIQLQKLYQEFDEQGSNKSYSVLQSIRKFYIESKILTNDVDSIFLEVIKKTKEKVEQSSNFYKIPIDELDLCANIVVVDAFIRCKIFENPNN